MPLIEHGHLHYGENKIQEAIDKWSDIRLKDSDIKLHLIGRLQTNKVKFALRLFDYIHSLDSEKLAIKISEEQKKLGASITGFTLYIFTVYSAIYGVLFFNEQLEYYHYIGTALVFGGVYIVKRKV